MDISLLLKAAGVGLICTVLCQILQKSGRDDMALLVSLAGIVTVFVLVCSKLAELVETLRGVFGI